MAAQLTVGLALLAAAWFMWWFIPRFTEWSGPGQPLWMIWISRAVGAAVFTVPAVYVIVGALGRE